MSACAGDEYFTFGVGEMQKGGGVFDGGDGVFVKVEKGK